MGFWTAATKIRFLEVCTAGAADIVFAWATGAHGDPNPSGTFPPPGDFDGLNGVLAHTLGGPPPNVFGAALAGDIHFDDDETWTLSAQTTGVQPIDLVTITAHELGHALGLDHTSVSGSLMLPLYTQSHRFLGADDIAGIQSLYGGSSDEFIVGPKHVCPNASFSIPDLPTGSGSTISWSSSNTGLVTINSAGLATRVGSGNGAATITASISSACGGTLTFTKTVTVGAPNLVKTINGVVAGTTPVIAGNLYNLNASSNSTVSTTFSYNNYTGTGNMTIDLYSPSNPATQMYVYSTSTSGSRYVRVTATNTCGSYYEDFVFYLMGGSMMAYPNPAKDILTLEFSNPEILEALPEQVSLLNEKSTKSVKTVSIKDVYDSKGFKDGNKIELDVSSLPRGTYYLHVTSGKDSNQKIEKTRILLE